MTAFVSGTVPNHVRPITTAKASVVTAEIGTIKNSTLLTI
jgi:hypothetical protein